MALLDDAAKTARSVAPLALLPALSTFIAFEKVVKTASANPGGGVQFPMPAALPDLWTFVSVPGTGVNLNLGVPLVLVPLFIALRAALVAGYVGSIDAAIEDRQPAFVQSAVDHAMSVLGVQVVTFALTLATFSLAFVGGMALAPVSVLLALAVGYLLWSAPILVVIRGYGIVDALVASTTLALDGGRYARFTATYLVGGIITSLVLSTLVRGRLSLIILAALLLAYPLLVISIATVLVVRSLPEVVSGARGTADRLPGDG